MSLWNIYQTISGKGEHCTGGGLMPILHRTLVNQSNPLSGTTKMVAIQIIKTKARSSYFCVFFMFLTPMPCRYVEEMARLPCWLPRGRQVSHQRWISGNVYHVRLRQVRIRLPTLTLKPRGDVTRSPKQGYQWPHKRTHVLQKKIFKNFHKNLNTKQVC